MVLTPTFLHLVAPLVGSSTDRAIAVDRAREDSENSYKERIRGKGDRSIYPKSAKKRITAIGRIKYPHSSTKMPLMVDYRSAVECNQADTNAVVEVEGDWIVATSAVVDNRSEVG